MSILEKAKQVAAMTAETARADEMPATVNELNQIIGYKPRKFQEIVEGEERRFNVEVFHRRFGKTVMKVRKLVSHAVFCPFNEGRYAYTAPTYQMAEDIAWMYLTAFHEKFMKHLGEDPDRWKHGGKLFVYFPTTRGSKARVRLYGVDNPKQRMRGLYLDGAVNDEWALSPPSVWTEQMRPMLSDENRRGEDEFGRTSQWCDFIFTPAGRNHAHTMYTKALTWFEGKAVIETDEYTGQETKVFRDDWYAKLLKASETGVISDQELKDAEMDMGRSKYLQEYECSFDAAVEGSILAKDLEKIRAAGQIRRVAINPLLPVNTAWDLGWDDATALWFFQQFGNTVHVVDYYENSGANLEHYAGVMADRGYRYGYNLLPHDVEVTELGSGKSRASILRSLGVRVTVVPRHSVHDGISAMQSLLPRCYFDQERCAKGLDRLSLYRREFNEKAQVFREAPLHDWASHGADAFRTLAMGIKSGTQGMGHNPTSAEM